MSLEWRESERYMHQQDRIFEEERWSLNALDYSKVSRQRLSIKASPAQSANAGDPVPANGSLGEGGFDDMMVV